MSSIPYPIQKRLAKPARSRSSQRPLLLLGLAFLSVFLGLLVVVLPVQLLVPLLVAPMAVAVCLIVPELAATLLLAAIFGVIPEAFLPRLPMAGGTLRAEEIGVIAFSLLLLLKNGRRAASLLSVIRPYWWPLGTLLLLAVVSALVSVMFKRAPTKDVLIEAKPFYFWLVFPMLALAIENDERMRRFKGWLMALAIALAVGVMFQSFTGIAVFDRGFMRGLYTVNESSSDVVRSTTPGMFLMAGCLLYLASAYTTTKKISLLFIVVAAPILLGGVIVGFGRGLWVAVAIGFVLLGLFARNARYAATAFVMTIAAVLVIGAISIAKPNYVEAFANRFTSIGEEVDRGTSFGRRKIENYYALEVLKESPFFGVGLGASYKPAGPESMNWPAETRYIHNTYLGSAVKIGLPGMVVVIWLVVVMLRRTWGAAKVFGDYRPVHFASMWVILAMTVITSVTQPNILSNYGVATIALVLYLSEWHRIKVGQDSSLPLVDSATVG